MKYCPKNKSHKNPKDAVFCGECGARLIEVVDNKVCLHCGAVNPTSAMFCKDCGAKLSDDKGNIELTVCSGEQCERILAVGTTSYQNNTSKCVLKVPAQKWVDVLLQCNGKAFRATADLTRTTTLTVNWGTIEIHCDNACQIRLEGNNMDTPLVKTALTGHETIKVPHGQYRLRVELDGEVEEKNLDVRGPVVFKSLLQRKYALTIHSDAQIMTVEVDDGEAIAVQKSVFNLKKGRGTYNLKLTVKSEGAWGHYEVPIDLSKDTTLNLSWCKIKIQTNSSEDIVFRQVGARYYYTYSHNGSLTLLAVQGVKHQLELKKPHGETHTEEITPDKGTMEIVRKWGDATITFDRAEHAGVPCRYYIYKDSDYHSLCSGSIPSNLSVSVKDLPYGRYRVGYGIDHDDYSSDYRYFTIDDNGPASLSVTIPTTRTQRAKWQWLRKMVFYITSFYFLPFVVMGGCALFFELRHGSNLNLLMSHNFVTRISIYVMAASSAITSYSYIKLVLVKDRGYVKGIFFTAISTIAAGLVASLSIDGDWHTRLFLFEVIESKWTLVLSPLVIFGIPALISFGIYNIKIKGYSIWQTLFK